MLSLQTAVAGILCLSMSGVTHSAEFTISCPPTVGPEAVRGNAPPGWRFAMPQAAQLTAAGMLHGPPEESGYLAPDENKDVRQGKRLGWMQKWRFGLPHSYPTFVYCGYGGGRGALQLFHPVPEGAGECTAAGSLQGEGLAGVVFVCR